MKKILLILSVFLLISGASAQTGKFLGGLNLSNYHSTDETTSQKFGYWGGTSPYIFGGGEVGYVLSYK